MLFYQLTSCTFVIKLCISRFSMSQTLEGFFNAYFVEPHSKRFWCDRSQVKPENTYFSQVPRQCWFYWYMGHTLGYTDPEDPLTFIPFSKCDFYYDFFLTKFGFQFRFLKYLLYSRFNQPFTSHNRLGTSIKKFVSKPRNNIVFQEQYPRIKSITVFKAI